MPSKKCTNLTTTLFVKKLEICSLNNSEMFKLRKKKTRLILMIYRLFYPEWYACVC